MGDKKLPTKRTEVENTRTTGSVIGGAILGASIGGPGGAIIGAIAGLFLGEVANDSKKNGGPKNG